MLPHRHARGLDFRLSNSDDGLMNPNDAYAYVLRARSVAFSDPILLLEDEKRPV